MHTSKKPLSTLLVELVIQHPVLESWIFKQLSGIHRIAAALEAVELTGMATVLVKRCWN